MRLSGRKSETARANMFGSFFFLSHGMFLSLSLHTQPWDVRLIVTRSAPEPLDISAPTIKPFDPAASQFFGSSSVQQLSTAVSECLLRPLTSTQIRDFFARYAHVSQDAAVTAEACQSAVDASPALMRMMTLVCISVHSLFSSSLTHNLVLRAASVLELFRAIGAGRHWVVALRVTGSSCSTLDAGESHSSSVMMPTSSSVNTFFFCVSTFISSFRLQDMSIPRLRSFCVQLAAELLTHGYSSAKPEHAATVWAATAVSTSRVPLNDVVYRAVRDVFTSL